jgi:phosphate transport system substrate-binding protein
MKGMSGEGQSIQKGSRKGGVRPLTIAIAVLIVAAVVGASAYFVFFAKGPEIVRIDGSSTVYPITSAWATEFNTPQRQVVVAFSGTGGGLAKFCRGETDLSDASRPIKQSERATCATNGVTGVTEFLIAYDGLSIVVPVGNTFAQNLTVKQLCRIWTQNTSAAACGGSGAHVTRWNALDPTWPDQEIKLFGPGTDSGTFDYFVEVVLTPTGDKITSNFFPSEDDNVLVQAVANEPYGLAYFGFAYLEENLDKIRPVAVDDENAGNGAGPVLPSETTIKDGTYAPLSRPLFIYGNAKSLGRAIVKDFLQFGYTARGTTLVELTRYVSLTALEIQAQVAKIPP